MTILVGVYKSPDFAQTQQKNPALALLHDGDI